jgi:Fe-S cluster biogenesis protein NfuA
MFIQTEQTPNPATLKFIPGRAVMADGTVHFGDAEDAHRSPLADKLFSMGQVEAVFFGADFITVTKQDGVEWAVLKPAILGAIMEHFVSQQPLLIDDHAGDGGESAADEGENAEIIAQIRELIETRVRPAVAQDGGDIVYRGFDHGIVLLEMRGACSGCPSSTATLKMGIENMLKHYVPEVIEVRAVV